jgi:hypothetical protein
MPSYNDGFGFFFLPPSIPIIVRPILLYLRAWINERNNNYWFIGQYISCMLNVIPPYDYCIKMFQISSTNNIVHEWSVRLIIRKAVLYIYVHVLPCWNHIKIKSYVYCIFNAPTTICERFIHSANVRFKLTNVSVKVIRNLWVGKWFLLIRF